MLREKNRFEKRRALAGRLCEGHVALCHTPRFKTKASSAPVPGLLKYSNEIALIRQAGRDYCKTYKEHLLTN